MTSEQIKAVVESTVNTLLKEDILKYSDLMIYERMSDRLREHYKKPEAIINEALEKLEECDYYDVLEMYYKYNMTLEDIAEEFDVDISTITRNKKRLCIKLFNLIH